MHKTTLPPLTVFNPAYGQVAGNEWLLAVRDKFGNYYAVPTGPGGGGGGTFNLTVQDGISVVHVSKITVDPDYDWALTNLGNGEVQIQRLLTVEQVGTGTGPVTVQFVQTIEFHPADDWNIQDLGNGVASVSMTGFTGTKSVCEGDGTLHTWTYRNGRLITAP
jgi:hypothetical protein